MHSVSMKHIVWCGVSRRRFHWASSNEGNAQTH